MPFEFLVGCLVCFTSEFRLKWNEVSESVSVNNAVFQAVFFVVVKIAIDVTLACSMEVSSVTGTPMALEIDFAEMVSGCKKTLSAARLITFRRSLLLLGRNWVA